MTTTALPTTRMFHEVRDQDQPRLDAETLIRETHAVFDQFGVQISPGRVLKLVRTYVRRVQPNGYDFGHYIATQIAVSETQRKVIADELRKVVSYADPTGEQATRNVLRGARQ